MLLVKTKVLPRGIHGLGLFSDEFIRKGTKVWEYNPKLDQLFSEEDINQLSESSREQLQRYAYLDRKYKRYVLCGDDARFFNHSINPNCDENSDDITIASRDISSGEELTVNYEEFYMNMDEHPEISYKNT